MAAAFVETAVTHAHFFPALTVGGTKLMLSDDEKRRIHHRLRRIIGQIEAVDRMVGEGALGIEVVMQISAATGALGKVAHLMLEDQLKDSLAAAAKSQSDSERQAMLDELTHLIDIYSQT